MSLHPYSGRHAVQSASLVVVFHSPLDSSMVSADQIAEAERKLKSCFTQVNPIQSFTFHLGPMGAPTAVPGSGASVGWEFSTPLKVPRDGQVFERSAVIQEDRLAITENNYTRWASFKDLIQVVLDEISGFVFEKRQLAFVAMGYSDIFVWKDDPNKIDASGVFKQETRFLPGNVFDIGPGLFHSNHGFFWPSNAEGLEHCLDNVNVSRVIQPESKFHNFVVNAEHRISADTPLFGSDARKFVLEHLELLHGRNKDVLGGLLLSEVQDQIKLWGAE